MKILIGIDGSEHSFAAASLAGRLLAHGRDQIALYHSCGPLTLADQVDSSLHERACQAVANVILDEAKRRLPQPLQADVEAFQGDGRAAEAIVEQAQRWGAELIVLGARGLGRMEGLLLGSVSSSVVRTAHVPVLVARGNHDEAEALRVLIAYDPVHAAQHADFIGKLTWPEGAVGRVAAVIDSMLPSHLPEWIQKRARDADTEAMSQVWVREHEQARKAKEQELASYTQRLPGPFRSSAPIVLEGNPAEQLMALVDREKPSIIVMGKAMKNFFDRWFIGSVSEKVLAHAGCSVLVIPAGKG
ncbi:MAG: universal stress protein [Pirellulales bacterium]